jgi:hypothetical protein
VVADVDTVNGRSEGIDDVENASVAGENDQQAVVGILGPREQQRAVVDARLHAHREVVDDVAGLGTISIWPSPLMSPTDGP